MLNEKSGTWIRLYKVFIVILFILCFAGGFYLGSFLGLNGFNYFCCVLLGIFIGCLQWNLNMLFLNFISNLQTLRQMAEKKEQLRDIWAEKRVLRPIK